MSYESTVLADSPKGYWRLGESSGTSAADASGNSQTGTYKNTPTLGVAGALAGDANTAVTLNGTTQSVSVADSATMDLGDVFTYEAWIKRSGTGLTDCILDKGEGAPIFRFDGEDHLLLRRNGVADIAKSTTKITDTNWHHVVATKTGATVKIYIDSVDVTGAVTNSTCVSTAVILSIGASEAGAEDFFHGSVDEAAVYGTALSAARVKAHFTAGTALSVEVSPPAAIAKAVAPAPTVEATQNIAIEPPAAVAKAVAPAPTIETLTTVEPPAAVGKAVAPAPSIETTQNVTVEPPAAVAKAIALAPSIEATTPEAPEAPNPLRVTEYPPMRQYTLATTPGGRTERWGEDELLAANVIEGLSDSDSVPGGYKDMTGALPRKPGVDYHDMKVGTRIENFGAGQYPISEYRLERTPRTSGDYLVMNPAASGYQVLLTDREEARALFLDSEMGGWGEPSAVKRLAYEASQYNANAQVSLAAAGGTEATPTPAAIVHAWAQLNNHSAANPDIAESEYDGAGIELGRVILDGVAGPGIGPGWVQNVWANVEEGAYGELLANFNGTSAEQVSVAIGLGHFLLSIQTYFAASVDLAGKFEALYRNIKVCDRSELPLYGTWPNVGVLASDAIAYSLSRWAPAIKFTTGSFGSLKPSNFVIEQLAFKEPTTVQDIITQALRFELLEWGVWSGENGPTFHLNPRGEREGRKRWRARVRPAKLTDTGQQMDQVWNKGVISYTGTDGVQRTVGPPGSGYQITDPRCEDTDPLNPINEAGEDRTKHLALTTVATAEGAAEVMQRFLEQAKLLDGSGEATLTGYVEDAAGALWPYYCVHAGDLIDFIDSSIPGYRYIVEATRNRADRSVNVKIDSPPDSYAALIERLGVREVTAGVSG